MSATTVKWTVQETTVGDGTRSGHFHNLGVLDGMPSFDVRDVLSSQHGGLWMATGAGLGYYDGRTIALYTQPDHLPAGTDIASALFEHHDGSLWFISHEGAAVTRLEDSLFTTFTAADGIPVGTMLTVSSDSQKRVLIAGVDGSCVYDGSSFVAWPEAGADIPLVSATLVDSDGRTWLATGNGVFVHGDQELHYTSTDGLPDGLIWRVVEDALGRVWIAELEGRVGYFEENQYHPVQMPEMNPQGTTIRDLHAVEDRVLIATDRGVIVHDGMTGQALGVRQGLGSHYVSSITVDTEGSIWLGTREGGLSRYEGERVVTFTVEDGLAFDDVVSLYEDSQRRLWVGTGGGGVTILSGEQFQTITVEDGLAGGRVRGIAEDSHGHIWFATHRGASRYDGQVFSTYGVRDGLPDDGLWAAATDASGSVWFGSQAGVCRYTGQAFEIPETGLGDEAVTAITTTMNGDVWIGSAGGAAARFDGSDWELFDPSSGLPGGRIKSIHADGSGIWFACGSGVGHYDGQVFTAYRRSDGLPYDTVWDVAGDSNGNLWFGTFGGGAARYDGQVFQTLGQRDGLANDVVQAILEDERGDIWFGTTAGLTRWTPAPSSTPQIRISAVVADQRYSDVEQVEVPSTVGLVAFEFEGISLKTPRGAMVYRYRLAGNEAWQTTTAERVEYNDIGVGEYVFEVVAVDRDLGYSAVPASVSVRVHPPYSRIALLALSGTALAFAAVAFGLALKSRSRRRLAEATLMAEALAELEEARQMQMGLMPTSPPTVSEFDIAGRCRTANHVGGDLFQFFKSENGMYIAVADVTGHAMEAAIPVVMFSGILDNQMEQPKPLPDLFNSLNRSLCRSLTGQRFICFTMAEIEDKTLRLASCGNPYPLHFHNGEVTELQVDGYPLGVREHSTYDTIETQLSEGDYLVLYSDGIPETVSESNELFGYERTMETVREACSEGISAEDLVERLMGAARAFAGDASQEDDMTCVVVRVEG